MSNAATLATRTDHKAAEKARHAARRAARRRGHGPDARAARRAVAQARRATA